MKFRPCIDIHNGKVKQIVGSTLSEVGEASHTKDNFVATSDAAYFATLYKERNLDGGHVIMLNPKGSKDYEETKLQAQNALKEYPGHLQVGGGITDENAPEWIDSGASHVIVTSFIFHNGLVDMDRLVALSELVSHKRLVLDLSVKKVGDYYHIATDRWQKITKEILDINLLKTLEPYCDEFLIHATDVEGKKSGVDEELIKILSTYKGNAITYAGGIRNIDDIKLIDEISGGLLDFTVGSALDIFGGNLRFEDVCELVENANR